MIVYCVRCGTALEMLPEVYRAVAPDGRVVCPQCASVAPAPVQSADSIWPWLALAGLLALIVVIVALSP